MDDSPIQTSLCVIGHPIGGNPTQFVALRALAALGLDWQFMSFDVDPLRVENAIAGIDSLGFCGAIIAAPYQTRVAEILARVAGEVAADPAGALWHDCLHRDDLGQLRARNVSAEALQSVIQSHSQSTGHLLEHCLWVGEETNRSSHSQPFHSVLPEYRSLVTGTKVVPWPEADTGASAQQVAPEAPAGEPSVQDTAGVESSPEIDAATDRSFIEALESAPTLVLWDMENKPSKKAVSKSSPLAPDAAFVAELLPRLHPGSLVIDLAGTSDAWQVGRAEAGEPSLAVINQMELEVMRLGLAIQHWTGHRPNLDLMREAIEEYLVI
ncbi:MAG: hypothetical protein ACO1RT_13420 [Planctomycetaceae bacterium]